MSVHWLDCDVLIQAKNLYYAFDLRPGIVFWEQIETASKAGKIRSPMMVHDELMRGGDELTEWAKGMLKSGLFVDPDEGVQVMVGRIGEHVRKRYEAVHAKVFLEGADPWVIASAAVHGGIVITHEQRGGDGCKRVKIPNVCDEFSVGYANCYAMLRGVG